MVQNVTCHAQFRQWMSREQWEDKFLSLCQIPTAEVYHWYTSILSKQQDCQEALSQAPLYRWRFWLSLQGKPPWLNRHLPYTLTLYLLDSLVLLLPEEWLTAKLKSSSKNWAFVLKLKHNQHFQFFCLLKLNFCIWNKWGQGRLCVTVRVFFGGGSEGTLYFWQNIFLNS